ncbi:BPTF-associated chromatin complex component 1 [Brevipalpus obovatus]|uniref:BPTF-associated chromatin complex component 1 n=1 Tax=Brevipalpus obovatus TaxID=246614 RepID=UPI003D9F6AD5
MSSQVTNRVGEIFNFAGQAFTKLSELTMHLELEDSLNGQKWDEEDVEMFKMTLKKFAEDLNKLSDNIKNKTINQIKGGIKRKIQDQKGLTISSPVVVKKVAVTPYTTPITNHSNDKNEPVKSESMLNSCNASSMDSVPDNP